MDLFRLDLSGIRDDAVGPEHGIGRDLWSQIRPRIENGHKRLLAEKRLGKLGFADLPYNISQLKEIHQIAQQVRYRYDDILVLGIGGSSLGLRCMVDALLNPAVTMVDRLDRRSAPRLHMCDNIDPDTFVPILHRLDWKKTLVNVVSKSGKTAETAAQFLIVRDLLEKQLGSEKWKDHVMITTDPASGPLRALAICEGVQSLAIPPNVGGRFSCLSPVALFPAACAGIDINAILAGAAAMADQCLREATDGNPAAELAAAHYLLDTACHKPTAVMMPYVDSLQRFSDWYVQLVAESLGKHGKGPTPTRALGASDQHAQLQLFIDGPNDKVITMITADNFRNRMEVPASDEPVYQFLGGHDLGQILNAEALGTARALREARRPVIHIALPQLNEGTLGQLLFCYEWMTALAGELYECNAFDQPGVERSKLLTREILTA